MIRPRTVYQSNQTGDPGEIQTPDLPDRSRRLCSRVTDGNLVRPQNLDDFQRISIRTHSPSEGEIEPLKQFLFCGPAIQAKLIILNIEGFMGIICLIRSQSIIHIDCHPNFQIVWPRGIGYKINHPLFAISNLRALSNFTPRMFSPANFLARPYRIFFFRRHPSFHKP